MAILLIDGFDHGDGTDVWTSFSASHFTTTKRTGTHSAQGIGAGGPNVYRALGAAEVDDGVTMGIACYQTSSQALGGFAGGISGGKIVLSEDLTVHLTAQFRNDTRTLEIWRGPYPSGTKLDFTDTNIWTHDTWHYLELGCKIHDSTGFYEVRLNGATVLADSGIDTRNGGTAGVINRMGFRGNEDIGSAQGIYFDDAYLLNETGSAPGNTFLGDTRCFPLYPVGNGFYAMLLGSDGNSVDNYLLVDETGTPVTTDYLASAVNADKDSFTLDNLPISVGTVRALEIRIHAAKSETGTRQMRSLIRRGGADAFGADHVLAENSYATYRDIWELDPHAGPGAWTITNINGSEIGVEVRP